MKRLIRKKLIAYFCLVFTSIFIFSQDNFSPSDCRNKFISQAKQYIGTPYVWGGYNQDGMDCSGFVYASALNSGLKPLPRTAKAIHSVAEKIPVNSLEPGDLVFFRTNTNENVCHVGIYLGKKEFIHCASEGRRTGVIVSKLSESYWKRNFLTAGRIYPSVKSKDNFPSENSEDNENSIEKNIEKNLEQKIAKTDSIIEEHSSINKDTLNKDAFVKPTNINDLSYPEKRKIFTGACISCLGIPYKVGGSSKSGVDNIGFIYGVVRDLFGAQTFPKNIQSLYEYAQLIPEKDAQIGDILFFVKNGALRHAGVYLGNGEFIHAYNGTDNPGVMISKIKDEPFHSSYYAIARIFAQ